MIPTATRHPAPPPYERSELTEAAWNHGYRLALGQEDGWLLFASETAPGRVALAAGGGWFLALEHAGAAAELNEALAAPAPPGFTAFGFAHQHDMRSALSRAYKLAVSLPSHPLQRFHAELGKLGDTETQALVKRRVGQDVFRAALLDYWGACPLTGITDAALLRASHIKPWADCATDAERLDVHNGLLLAAHWDAAFDAGLVTFDEAGRAVASPHLSVAARTALSPSAVQPLPLKPAHHAMMAWHRAHVFQA